MRKLKLLLATCALLGGVFSANADDVFKDVTATYLTNADFEGEYTVYSNPKSDRAIYQPSGWTISYTNGKEWDITCLKSGDLSWSSFSSKPLPDNSGSQTYWIRFNNSYKDQQLELSQTVTLPKSSYQLTADHYKGGSGGDAFIFVGSTTRNGTNDSWTKQSISFTSDGNTSVKIGCRATHTNTYEKFYAFDNFVLKWNLTQSLANLIEEAEGVYVSECTLAGMTTMKAALDDANTNKNSTDADILEEKYNALNDALPLAKAAKTYWTAKTNGQNALDNTEYANITGNERTTLNNAVVADVDNTIDSYNNQAAAIDEAKTTFTGAKDSYDALANVNALITTAGTLAYADSEKKPSGEVSATSAEDAVTKTADQYTALRAYYESHALAEGIATTMNITSRLTNYVNPSNTTGWTINNTTGNSKMRTQSNQPYTNSDGTVATGYFDSDSWNAAFTTTFTQNVTLPAGTYLLTMKARGNDVTTYKVVANDTKADITEHGNTGGVFGNGWDDYSVEFTLTAAGSVTLGVEMETGNSSNWLSFGDFRLMKLDASYADNDDYAALNAAISTAEGKILGFQTGEYAPYNNIEALALLAAAKAIDQDAENIQSDVQTAATALAEATWTANESEVNAIWDSSFEHEYSTSGNVQPIAWKGTSGHDNATDVRWMWNVSSNAGLAATSSSKALFTKYGAFYGQEDGYTLPLNEETYYTVSFKYGGWDDCKKDGYVTMSDPSSTSLSLIPSDRLPLDAVDGNSNTASWKNYQAFFKTNAAGNYVLGLRKDNENQQSQYVYGDFVLKQTTIAEATTYYNSVKTAVEGDYDADANGGSEKTAFKTALDANVSAYTIAQLMEAAASLKTLRDAFVAATPIYDKYAEECTRAIELGVTSEDIAALTVASDYQTKLQALIVQEDDAVRSGYPVNVTGLLELGTENRQNTGVGQNEHWYGPSYSYFNMYKSEGFTMSVKNTVTLPAGSYVYKGAARCNKVNQKDEYYIGVTPKNGTLKKELFTSYNGATGKGIDNDGHANYGDGDFVNNGSGYGWEWRFVGFTLEEPTEVELKITANILAGGWVSFADMCLLSQGLTITEDAEDTKINVTNPINVTLDRAFNAGWNAVCLPFATTKASLAEGAEFYEFTGDTGGENVTLNFSSVDNDNFEANTPYLVYLPAAVEGGKVFNGVNYDPAEAKTTGTAFDFKGVYAVTNIAEGSWVISGGALKKASAAIDLKPTRAYFAPKASTARIAGFTIDGDEATGLMAVMAEQGLPVDGIYNLKGQKVSGQLKKGIYVVNGKKIVK